MGKVFKALGKISSLDADSSTPVQTHVEEKNDPQHQADDPREAAPELFRSPPAETKTETDSTTAPLAAEADFFQQSDEQSAQKWHERLTAASATASLVREEFRRLRTHILHPPHNRRPARTILVVSTAPEEGKSLVCAGLGLALAQGVKEHALLIDCDLRRPSLAGLFSLGNERGVVDYLQNGIDLGQLIRKTGFPKLSVIPSGQPPFNPAELLGSEKVTAMIHEVANRYSDRFVVFDSPPLGSAAETAILAEQVEGIVLVVREGKSRREDVKELLETIGPEKIVGLVYNDYRMNLLESSLAGYPYYHYNSYSGRAPDTRS